MIFCAISDPCRTAENSRAETWNAFFVAVFVCFPVKLPTLRVVDHALSLADRYSLSHWDSMLLGACKDAGVVTVYTEDIGAPIDIDGITLVNPFI